MQHHLAQLFGTIFKPKFAMGRGLGRCTWIPRLFDLKIALLLTVEFSKSQRQVFQHGHICFVWFQVFISIISPGIHGRRFKHTVYCSVYTFVARHIYFVSGRMSTWIVGCFQLYTANFFRRWGRGFVHLEL